MLDERPTVPCELCGMHTPMTGTKRCDGCWGMERETCNGPAFYNMVAKNNLTEGWLLLFDLKNQRSEGVYRDWWHLASEVGRRNDLSGGGLYPKLINQNSSLEDTQEMLRVVLPEERWLVTEVGPAHYVPPAERYPHGR